MSRLTFLLAACLGLASMSFLARASEPVAATRVLLVLGAAGEPEFEEAFLDQITRLSRLSEAAGCSLAVLGTNRPIAEPAGSGATPAPEPGASAPATQAPVDASAPAAASVPSPVEAAAEPAPTDRDRLRMLIEAEPKDGHTELWLILVGHGTFDGKEARFNLQGPDVSATDLAEWLKPFRRPVAVINTASSSGPFLPKLAATNRVVVTATRSGYEQNYTRFGDAFARALADPGSDLDQDGQTSLLEAFLGAAHRVAEFYKTEGRLATEHALIDDNGDGLGTAPDWFRGLRAVKRAKDNAPVDGLRAHQFHLVRSAAELALAPEIRARRDDLEGRLARLRDRKEQLGEDDYYGQLEALLLDLARLYQSAEPKPASGHER